MRVKISSVAPVAAMFVIAVVVAFVLISLSHSHNDSVISEGVVGGRAQVGELLVDVSPPINLERNESDVPEKSIQGMSEVLSPFFGARVKADMFGIRLHEERMSGVRYYRASSMSTTLILDFDAETGQLLGGLAVGPSNPETGRGGGGDENRALDLVFRFMVAAGYSVRKEELEAKNYPCDARLSCCGGSQGSLWFVRGKLGHERDFGGALVCDNRLVIVGYSKFASTSAELLDRTAFLRPK